MKDKVTVAFKKIVESTGKWRRKALELVVLISCLALVITTISYSWIRRKWTPSISQDAMQIMAGESLVFSLIGSNNPSTLPNNSISLNSILKLQDFIFKPVSNFSGRSNDFFSINTNEIYSEYFVHLMQGEVITKEGWTLLGQNNGYIEFTFVLQGRDVVGMTGQDYTKYVYLSPNSYIRFCQNANLTDAQKTAENAMRVSLTIGEEDDAPTYIFVNSSATQHKAINNTTRVVSGTTKWVADGTMYRATADDTVTAVDAAGITRRMLIDPSGSQTDNANKLVLVNDSAFVGTFSEYSGGFTVEGGTFDPSKTLFSMNVGATETITLRIWLEGEDPYCTAGIKGSKIDFYLGFESYNYQGTTPGGDDTTSGEQTTPPESSDEDDPIF